ncbi:hypothetical protein [Hasllibacter sp. MH4015]|uniref:hypothetical protein n=1 Tax=Hasllibacter sp. MH4015 TaxID=2854029 RepID=UPI001CD3E0FD|nr:hypothetical protein [Hasllibacter sp. MH4015]
MEFGALVQTLTDWVVGIGHTVNDLPGTVAFGLGLFTWFAVEQILQRVLNGLRWAILIGVIVALGLSLPYLASLMMGGAPPQ